MRLPFGKYRGVAVPDLPDDYLGWLHDTVTFHDPHLRAAVEREYLLRFEPSSPPPADVQSMVNEIVVAGFRSLARRYHPDVGGNTQTMQLVNDAYDRLRKLVE